MREAFLKRLTVDSETKDMRRREFNQALFIAEDDKFFGGAQVFVGTTLRMVMQAFDDAVRDVQRSDKITAKAMRRSMQKVTDHG